MADAPNKPASESVKFSLLAVAYNVVTLVLLLFLIGAACRLRLAANLTVRHGFIGVDGHTPAMDIIRHAPGLYGQGSAIGRTTTTPCTIHLLNRSNSKGGLSTGSRSKLALLFGLLLTGVEMNPGPVRRVSRQNITIGTLNTCSAVNNAAELHHTIEEEQLDFLALCETWIPLDAPDPSVSTPLHTDTLSSTPLVTTDAVAVA